MTDKEIAGWLRSARIWAGQSFISHKDTYFHARQSVRIIHHIINSINWED